MLEAYLCANHQKLDWLNARQTQNKEVGATGLEPVKDSSRNTHVSLLSDAECDAYLNDADLEAVVNSWSKLPSALKAGIVAMVRATEDAK